MELAPIVKERPAPDRGTSVLVGSDADIVSARQQGRSYALGLGFSSPEATLVATAISELARNIVQYAERGEIVIRSVERDGRSGLLVVARDEGPGIPEQEQLEIIGVVPGRGDRLGLRAMKRFVDDLEVVSSASQGTTIRVTKWKQVGEGMA